MVYNNISDYIKANLEWELQHTAFNGSHIIVNGNAYTPSEFYKANPKPTFEPPLNENNPGKPSVASGCKTRKR